MGKPLSVDLRKRIRAFVEGGESCRKAAVHFDVAPSTVINLMALVRASGSVEPARQGRPRGTGKLAAFSAFLKERVAGAADMTMPELADALHEAHGISAAPASLSRFLIREGYSFKKKTLIASERRREKVRRERRVWTRHRQPRMQADPGRLVFLDETGTTTKMTRLRGRSRRGTRLEAEAPFGHWQTQTFIAALRCDGLIAPWVLDGPMNRAAFDSYIEGQLAPALEPGDIVILDNLSSHKSEKAAKALKERGAWFLFLPSYSPDLNPIEMAFSKLKAHLRAIKARTFDDLWRAIGNICDLYTSTECWNYLKAAGYAHD